IALASILVVLVSAPTAGAADEVVRAVARGSFASGVDESVAGKDAEAGDAQASSMQAEAASDGRSQHDAEKTSGNRSNWSQFRGPNRDGKSVETGLLKQWPDGGPKLLWATKEDLGKGWSHPVIANDTIYTLGNFRQDGILFALDMDGQLKWKKTYGPEWYRTRPGTRSVPTIDGDRIYFFSGVGTLYCYDAKNGEQKWVFEAAEKYQGTPPRWAYAESPLIAGDVVFCTPGGKLATMVALNKITGEVIWETKELTDGSAYCSPILINHGGNKIIVTMTNKGVVGIDPASGKLLWKDPFAEYMDARMGSTNPVSPTYHDGFIYTTAGYDAGGALLKLSPDGASVTRQWVDTTLDNHHGGVIIKDGYIYGSNFLSNTEGNWCCLEFKTGKVMYETTWNNKGSMIYADGLLYCYDDERGNLALVKPDPAGFEVVSSFQITQGSGEHWAHPVICDGRLYIRRGKSMMAYDIKAGDSAPVPGDK
ncbi:MAG: PQQ-like beta-propeller repeat protein, partial [Planctomycetes bacterium]|nr:PQQ-like beta-propeller repeat protein [Planctomycetota bacterium]